MKIKMPSFKKNNPLFWLYIIFGFLLILLSIILAPLWDNVQWAVWKNWGADFINLLIAVFLSIYLFGFLLKKIIKTNNQTIKMLTVVEFTLLILIDLYLVFGTFGLFQQIIAVNGACAITGLALWIRGVVEIFRAYFYQRQTEEQYPIWWLCISIAFVSVGLWMLINPFITDLTILWIFIALAFALGIFGIGYGRYAKPNKKNKKNDEK